MLALNNLEKITKKRKRVGRGGSRGGTSGKGHKGQKARSGPSLGLVFEGGQMPLTRRLPKRGFNNAPFKEIFEIVNLQQLQDKFEAGATVDRNTLLEKNIIKGIRGALIKILGNGDLNKKLIIHADAFSASAVEAIKGKGGEVHVTKER